MTDKVRLAQVGLGRWARVLARGAQRGDVIELVGLQSRLRQARRRRQRREPRDMLDAIKALLLGGGHELAVDDESRSGVAVVRVQSEDRRHAGRS